MWPLGHAVVAYLLHSLGSERGRLPPIDAGALAALLVGSQLPDLVDKPLSWQLGVLETGRSLGHSLLVLVPCCVVALVIARRSGHRALGIALVVGVLSHPVVDAVPVLWTGLQQGAFLLWPITAIPPYESGPPSVLVLLRESLTEPWFVLELVLTALAGVRWRQDGAPGLAVLRDVPDQLRRLSS